MNCNVFVYGTLMYEQIVTALTGLKIATCKAFLPHYKRFRIHEPGRDAKGPAIAEYAFSHVEGKVLLGVTPRAAEILDLFELAASGYERVREIAYTPEDEELVVQVYRAPPKAHRLLWGEWTEKEFEASGFLTYYLTERIPYLKAKWVKQGLCPDTTGA